MERIREVLHNLKISTRLKFMIAVPLLMMLGTSILSWHRMNGSTAGLQAVNEDRAATYHLGSVGSDMYHVRMVLMTGMITEDPKEVERLAKGLDARIESIRKSWAAYLARAATPEEKALSSVIGQDLEQVLGAALQPAIKALQAGDLAAVRKITMQQDNRALTTKVREGLDKLEVLLEKGAREQHAAAVDRTQELNLMNMATLACATVLLTMFCWWVMRAITVPVSAMQRALVEAQ